MKLESITPMEATSRSQAALDGGPQLGPAEALHDQVVRREAIDCAMIAAGVAGRTGGTAASEDEQPYGRRDQRGEALEEVVERPRHGLREEVEGANRVALEPDQRVGRPGRHGQAEHDEQHTDDEVEHVRRRAHVALGHRLLDLVRRPGAVAAAGGACLGQ